MASYYIVNIAALRRRHGGTSVQIEGLRIVPGARFPLSEEDFRRHRGILEDFCRQELIEIRHADTGVPVGFESFPAESGPPSPVSKPPEAAAEPAPEPEVFEFPVRRGDVQEDPSEDVEILGIAELLEMNSEVDDVVPRSRPGKSRRKHVKTEE